MHRMFPMSCVKQQSISAKAQKQAAGQALRNLADPAVVTNMRKASISDFWNDDRL